MLHPTDDTATSPDQPLAGGALAGRAAVEAPRPSPGKVLVRYLDLVVLALALPLFLAAGFPMLGYATAAGAWLIQRGAQALMARRAMAATDVRGKLGWTASSMLARGWFVALVVLLVGLRANDAGLAAAVLVVVLFTVYFALELALRPFEQLEARR